MAAGSQSDASFFELVHQLVHSPPDGQDRRERNRRTYSRVELVAPFVEGRVPHRSEFREVRLNDISEQGFSYLAPQAPDSDNIVMVLGEPPTCAYLTAVVCHCTPKKVGARTRYLVGCRFTGRVEDA